MVGKTLGHYKVVRKLGQGGMGEVYVAQDTKLNREVALKVLPADVAADPERRARFEREARAVAALNHPNIVTIFSVEEVQGVHFLTMERVDGQTLTELIPDTGLTLPKLFELALPLTDAVATAHETGITHRDLKPDNIMVDSAGRLKVLDFGLAKLREDPVAGAAAGGTQMPTASVTQEGKILGTAAYMSPEQAEGKTVDPRSDVFSLGIILYEMSTGQRPFQGDTAISTISSILREQPQSITALKHNLPRHLGRITKRALAKDPQRRYQSAIELRNELEELKGEIDSGELEVGAVTAQAAAPRSRMGLWLGLLAVILAGAAVIVPLVRAPGTTLAPNAASRPSTGLKMSRVTVGGRTGAVAISPDGKYLAYALGDAENKSSLRLRQLATGSDVEILPPDRLSPWGTQFSRDGTYIYFNRGVFRVARTDLYPVPALGGEPRRIVEDVDSEVNFSPGGDRIVFLRGIRETGETQLILAGADGSGETVLTTRKGREGFNGPTSWSADGTHILATLGVWPGGLPHSQHVAIPVDGGEPKPIGPPWRSRGRPTPLLDGSGYVFIGADSWFSGDQLWFYPLPDGPARPITADLANYDDPSITADGTMLVTGREESWSSIWVAPADDLSAMQPRVPESEAKPGDDGLAWGPDGSLVYSVISGGEVLVLRMLPADGGPSRPISEGEHIEAEPALTSDGRVAFMTGLGDGINIWIRDLAGGNLRQLTSGLTFDPQMTPDDKWIFYRAIDSGVATLWKVAVEGGDPIQVVDSPITGYVLSPGGTMLAVRFVDPETSRYESKILSLDGELIRSIEGIPSPPGWGTDDETLIFIKPMESVGNLWTWPLDGSEPTQLTTFDDPEIGICDYEWSRDHKQLAVVRCRSDRNAVTITDFR
jgi:Tol biopolymer transport system component/predicted Ser/Thr protein kinase